MTHLIATAAPDGQKLTQGLWTSRNVEAVARAAGVDLPAFDGQPWPVLRRALVPAIHRIAADPHSYDLCRPVEEGSPASTVERFLVAMVYLFDLHPGTVRVG